jgi:RNA polymerase sigma-70 factor (ECF subfamily)
MTHSLPRFETLIERYHDEIYGYLWRLLDGSGGAADAEDLTQEVFMRAYRAFARLRPDSNVRAWLYKIATNCAYTFLKRNRHRAQLISLDDTIQSKPDGEPSRHDQVVLQESVERLRQAIRGLPPKQQAALVMRYIQELEYAEIAAAMGCSEEAARANVYQAIRRLRRDLA